jgi:AraC family transcriptional regulator
MLPVISFSLQQSYGPDGRLLPFSKILPADYKEHFDGVTLSHGQTTFEDKTLIAHQYHEFIGLVFNFSDHFDYALSGGLSGTFYGNHFNLLYLPPDTTINYHFYRGTYEILVLELTRGALEYWSKTFPVLKQYMINVNQKIPTLGNCLPLKISVALMTSFNMLLKERMIRREDRESFINSRVHEIFSISFQTIARIGFPFCLALESSEISGVRKRILDALDHEWTLDQLASEVGMDKKRLTRLFRKTYGQSVMAYIHEERMQRALVMLRDPNMPIKAIAMALGYKNPNHFSQAFKAKFTFSPGELRLAKMEFQ